MEKFAFKALLIFATLVGAHAHAYTQWEWKAVGIIETNYGSTVLHGPTTTFATKEEALAAIPRPAPYAQVPTEFAGISRGRDGRVEYKYLAPHAELEKGPWDRYIHAIGNCNTFPTEAALISCLENHYRTQTSCHNAVIEPPSSWTPYTSYPLTREYGDASLNDPDCSSHNKSLRLQRRRDVSCPSGYSVVSGRCSNTYAAVISAAVLECPATSPSATVGNPCNVANGDKSHIETDYAAPNLAFTRYYHSATLSPYGDMGIGWSHNFLARIILDGTTPVALARPSGNHEALAPSGSIYRSTSGSGTRVTRVGSEFHARLSNGDTEIYSTTGELQSFVYRGGTSTTLQYAVESGTSRRRLAAVIASFGHQLIFNYTEGRLTSLTTPDGGVITFQYDSSNNLSRVVHEDTTSRQYLYEDARFPNHLTGIVDESESRFSTYTYDSSARVETSERALGTGSVHLTYNSTSTIVTDAAGLQSTFSFVDSSSTPRRITSVACAEPAFCAMCGCSNHLAPSASLALQVSQIFERLLDS